MVCDLNAGTSDDAPDTLSVMPDMNARETLPLRQVINNPICNHAASQQFCSRIRDDDPIVPRLDMR